MTDSARENLSLGFVSFIGMGKYDLWRGLFGDSSRERFVVSIDELEDMIGSDLPRSARTYQAWWGSGHSQAVWLEHGYTASPDFRSMTVTFRRKGPVQVASKEVPSRTKADGRSPEPILSREASGPRLVLVGCVKTKVRHRAPAKDLYDSPLWERRRRYAESTGMPWAILSAEHGLVDPGTLLEPYDRYLGSEPSAYRRQWSNRVAGDVLALLGELGLRSVELHAGAAYVQSGLASALRDAGVVVSWPVRGLTIGQQLGWYR